VACPHDEFGRRAAERLLKRWRAQDSGQLGRHEG
jgi:hypothetical protein